MSIAYLFPGQGSQHVGMGQPLYEQQPAARAVFDQADAILGRPISQICFEGPEETLKETVNQQPALFVTSLAMLAVLKTAVSTSTPPAFVAGHSLGEFSALVAAGSLTFEDGLKLVQRRGELMRYAGELAPGAMAAILALNADQVAAICAAATEESGRSVQIANDNCPGQLVISGDEQAILLAMEKAKEAGARKVVQLPISIAAHSPLMASVANQFNELIDSTTISNPQMPLIANVTAKPLTKADDLRSELKAQLVSPVSWTRSMQYLVDNEVETFVEVGPGDVLRSLMKRIHRKSKRLAYDQLASSTS